MIELSSASASEFENLPDHTLVYRALRKGWIDRSSNRTPIICANV
jgi:hypothetical protein